MGLDYTLTPFGRSLAVAMISPVRGGAWRTRPRLLQRLPGARKQRRR